MLGHKQIQKLPYADQQSLNVFFYSCKTCCFSALDSIHSFQARAIDSPKAFNRLLLRYCGSKQEKTLILDFCGLVFLFCGFDLRTFFHSLKMTTIDIPDEYMHCFNVMDEIPRYDPMESEIQELLDLVIEQGLSARKAGFIVGIVERTVQRYVKQYKEDNEKRLPGQKKKQSAPPKKLEPLHTDFLCSYFDKKPEAVLWQARDALLERKYAK
ncbi:hypothetical protein BD560DRAFT_491292 [Blakeslea trispora]|nr:hypothetical protein BD560DRAFT_491292 [Blakeslea trispora]